LTWWPEKVAILFHQAKADFANRIFFDAKPVRPSFNVNRGYLMRQKANTQQKLVALFR